MSEFKYVKDYDFKIANVISEAWDKVSGFKASYWGAMLVLFCISIFVSIIFSLPSIIKGVFVAFETGQVSMELQGHGLERFDIFFVIQALGQIIVWLISFTMTIGIMVMGVNRVVNREVTFKDAFKYFPKMHLIVGVAFFCWICQAIGLIFLIIPGIYLSVAYIFAVIVSVEKKVGIWEAMETSRRGVTKHWFKVLFTLIIIGIINLIGTIPLGIGLIWTIPMTTTTMGILYREAFGVEDVAVTQAEETATVSE